jgi:hypothetical protein
VDSDVKKPQQADCVPATRVSDLLDEYQGCLSTGGDLAESVQELREEWD